MNLSLLDIFSSTEMIMNLSLFDIFSGTAGGIGSVMAALGALKLGALTFLHRDSLDIKTRSTLHIYDDKGNNS